MDNQLKNKLIAELKAYFGEDERRVGHALGVLKYAEEILGDNHIEDGDAVIAAAILHDTGIREAERRRQSSSAQYQEELGPEAAREILTKSGQAGDLVDHVCEMIAHHHHPKRYFEANPRRPQTPFHILVDADRIVNTLSGEYKPGSAAKYFTEGGLRLARSKGLVKETGPPAR